MRERSLAKKFAEIFHDYTVHVIDTKRQAGWPDRMIQCIGSIVVMVEIKVVKVRPGGRIILHEFRHDQAAFMYKWQRKGGLCFLFVGTNCGEYGIITCIDHHTWIVLPGQELDTKLLGLWTKDTNKIEGWFRQYLFQHVEKIKM